MKLKCVPLLALFFCALAAQTPSQDARLISDQIRADRDIFGAGSPNPNWPNLTDRAHSATSNLTVVESGIPWLYPEESDPALRGTQKGADLYVSRAISNCKIAVIGTVTDQVSSFNSNKTRIVTDSLVEIDEVVQAKSGFDVRPGSKIVVARSGGTMEVDGRQVRVLEEGFPPFVTGSKYLLLLYLNPKSGSYSVHQTDAFLIEGQTVRPVYEKGVHPAAAYLKDTQSLIEALRNSAAEVGK
jgi:hypothetical protein